MGHAFTITKNVMASVVRGIFLAMENVTMTSIGKNVMESVFGRPSHVLLLA